MIVIDKLSRTPIYEQVVSQFCRLILSGALRAGDQIPSVRALSEKLGVNPNTLQKAYTELETRGITTGKVGIGRFVSEDALQKVKALQEIGTKDFKEVALRMKEAGVPMEALQAILYAVYRVQKEDDK